MLGSSLGDIGLFGFVTAAVVLACVHHDDSPRYTARECQEIEHAIQVAARDGRRFDPTTVCSSDDPDAKAQFGERCGALRVCRESCCR